MAGLWTTRSTHKANSSTHIFGKAIAHLASDKICHINSLLLLLILHFTAVAVCDCNGLDNEEVTEKMDGWQQVVQSGLCRWHSSYWDLTDRHATVNTWNWKDIAKCQKYNIMVSNAWGDIRTEEFVSLLKSSNSEFVEFSSYPKSKSDVTEFPEPNSDKSRCSSNNWGRQSLS